MTLPAHERIAILARYAVTCDDDFTIFENAAIHIESGAISYVGAASTRPPFQAQETLSGKHLVAIPGLINTHTHAAMTLLRGYADDMPLESWLRTKIWPFEKHLDEGDVRAGTDLALCEMLRGGTTCFADMYHFYETGAAAVIDSGMRAVVAGVFLGFLPEAPRRLRKAVSFAREYSGAGDGRISTAIGPHSLYTCDKTHWHLLLEAARELGVLLHTHVAETRAEIEDVISQWGVTPVRALHAMGALEHSLLAAHCVYLDEEERELVASTREGDTSRFRVAHNPTSNLKLASGIAPIEDYLRRGITVSLGPDGASSNNVLDMWREMRLAALLHKATSGDATAVSAQQALLMATIEGARALNLGKICGSLEVEKRADIALLDFDAPHLTPCHHVVSHLVYAANAADVQHVVVDGRILMRDRKLTQLDEARIKADASTRAAHLAIRATE
jgi:5-methylthioadenosine/S-adenosylhomocysteine deaminase